MLKQRVLTALVLIPLVVWAIFGLDTTWLALLFAVLVLMGGWEWARLVPLEGQPARWLFLFAVTLGLGLAWGLLVQRGTLLPVLVVALLWWIIATYWVIGFREGAEKAKLAKLLAGLTTLVPAWAALVGLHYVPEQGPWLLLFVLVLMWVADSGAYFSGRIWGKHKLAPHVSPGKTWEGVAGGIVATTIYAAVAAHYLGFQNYRLALFVIVSIVTVGFSIVGDLLESVLKRERGVKDSGTLLPGHGGVLDRVDSVTAGAPVFLLGYSALEWMV